MENKQNNKNKKTMTIVLIAALILALALAVAACSMKGSTAEPEESPAAESAAPSAQVSGKPEATKAPESTAKPAATEAPEATAAPANTGSIGNTSSTGNTGTANTNPGSQAQDKDQAEEHQHSWQPVYTTVHHEEKGHTETVTVQAAWDEQETVFLNVCNACGATGGNDISDHIFIAHDGDASYHAEYVPTGNVIHHEAVTEQRWVVDSPAWDEQVISYYTCSCGQARQN